MVKLATPLTEFIKPGQQWPHRVVLRDGDKWFRVLDLQVVFEKNDGLSIYLKPPIDGLFVSKKPTGKFRLPTGGGTVDIKLSNDITESDTYFNAYLSWHGSGRLHANGYTSKNLKKDKLIGDSEAISINDVVVPPHIVLTSVIPINTLSYYQTSPPPKGFSGNYYEVSDKPYLPQKLDGEGSLNFVFDRAALSKGNSVVLDVMVHNQGAAVDLEKNHPYPNNAEIYFVAPPLQISPTNPTTPAVTPFFYQPINSSTDLIQANPLTFWGRSKNQQQDFVLQAVKLH